MKLLDHVPNSNGKFEFQIDDSIRKNIETNSRYAFKFAQHKFNTFKETFGIKEEPCVFEAKIETFVAILAGILEEFETAHTENNILNIKP
jgi:hypothetical protein